MPQTDPYTIFERGAVAQWEKDLLVQFSPRTARQDIARLERANRLVKKAKELTLDAMEFDNMALDYSDDANETWRFYKREEQGVSLTKTLLASSDHFHAKAARRFDHADRIREELMGDTDLLFSMDRLARCIQRSANAASAKVAAEHTEKVLVNA